MAEIRFQNTDQADKYKALLNHHKIAYCKENTTFYVEMYNRKQTTLVLDLARTVKAKRKINYNFGN